MKKWERLDILQREENKERFCEWAAKRKVKKRKLKVRQNLK
jgi:hypothetical protein